MEWLSQCINMTENTTEKVLETELAYNKQEVDISNNLGIADIPSSHIFVIESCRKKERRNLTVDVAEMVQKDIAETMAKYSEKTILGLVQFKKGITKTHEQIENAMKCNLFNGSDGVCLYETNPQQMMTDLKIELPSFLKIADDFDKYFVIEMDGNEVLEKVNFILSLGIKNFILIAGNYKDEQLWQQVIKSVLSEKGKSIVLLPKRMHPITKKSYIDMMIEYGASIVVHGMAFGGGKSENVLFLDSSDITYKVKSALPNTNLLFSDEALSNLADAYEGNRKKEYAISRVCSLKEGILFCKTNRRKIVI